MTYLSFECTSTDGEKKVFKTYPEAAEWRAVHGGTIKQLEDFVPSEEEEYCRVGAASANKRWKNYKF